jgi:hypothetical protein
MTTHRRYSFETKLTTGHEDAARVIWDWVTRFWWYKDPLVSREGPLTFSFTVSGRDQWWTHQRALRLGLGAVYAAGGLDKDVPLPTWEKLPPHTNRGYLITH